MENIREYLANVYSQEIYSINVLEPRFPDMPMSALGEKDTESVISLDGEWKFMWFESTDDLDVSFLRTDLDISGWDTITVPSNWE
ncbi:MAG: hypothetical protein R3232_10535, partial [Clostridia bacterium]|nr:hypothetical protein [Clostridia bacterium]